MRFTGRRMSDKSKVDPVSEEEIVAMANTLNLFLNPPRKRFGREDINQFGLLVSLLKKLVKQVYG